MEDDAKLRVRQFDGKSDEDFQLWSLRVMSYLESKELARYVTGSFELEEPKGNASAAVMKRFKEYETSLKKARAVIVSALGDRPLRAIQSCRSLAEMWDKLKERYASTSNSTKISVLTTLMNKRCDVQCDIQNHVSEMESMFSMLLKM